MKCSNPNCLNETDNPKFCSSSCAAKVTNSQKPKRLPTGSCKYCNSAIPKSRWYCNETCKANYRLENTQTIYADKHSTKTLSDLTYSTTDQNKYVKLRRNAQLTYKHSGRAYRCASCGYDKHVEICHIKAIADYPLDTLISMINSIENLVALCPNCHWEFDHGMLEL